MLSQVASVAKKLNTVYFSSVAVQIIFILISFFQFWKDIFIYLLFLIYSFIYFIIYSEFTHHLWLVCKPYTSHSVNGNFFLLFVFF